MLIPNYIKAPLHPITVNVIGVGGTGSLVVPRLARMDYGLKLLGHPGLMVFAYDDDIVEPFNVGRQNFTDLDIGTNKAVCMIEKCNLGFGVLWEAIPKRFTGQSYANINIICVDNVEFRNKFYMHEKSMNIVNSNPYNRVYFNIDGGNGKDFGQIVISSPEKKNNLKTPFELFPEMINQDNEEAQGITGCSYEESLEKQDFFINDEIALGIMKLMWKLFREETITINALMVNQQKCKQIPILKS